MEEQGERIHPSIESRTNGLRGVSARTQAASRAEFGEYGIRTEWAPPGHVTSSRPSPNPNTKAPQ